MSDQTCVWRAFWCSFMSFLSKMVNYVHEGVASERFCLKRHETLAVEKLETLNIWSFVDDWLTVPEQSVFLFNTCLLFSILGHSTGALAVNNMVSASAGFFSTNLRNFSPLLTHTLVFTQRLLIQASLRSFLFNRTRLLKCDVMHELCVCCRGCMAWLPTSFAWGNFSVLAVGVWAIAQRDSIDAVLMVSVCLDSSALAAILTSCDMYRSLTIGAAVRIHANLFVDGM